MTNRALPLLAGVALVLSAGGCQHLHDAVRSRQPTTVPCGSLSCKDQSAQAGLSVGSCAAN
jgi:hypothetical protein